MLDSLLNERGVAFTGRKTWPARSPTAVGRPSPTSKGGSDPVTRLVTTGGLAIFKVPNTCISVTGPRRMRKNHAPVYPPTDELGPGSRRWAPHPTSASCGRHLRHFHGVQTVEKGGFGHQRAESTGSRPGSLYRMHRKNRGRHDPANLGQLSNFE